MDIIADLTEARRLVHLGQNQQAITVIQGILQRYGPVAEAHALMGATVSSLGDLAAATSHFEQAVRLDPTRASYHYNLGVAYERAGNAMWALEAYRHALEVDAYFPQACEAYYRLAPQIASSSTAPTALPG